MQHQIPTLVSQAEELADIMLELAKRPASKGQRPTLKLPPVFTAENDIRYGEGRQNLVAMIKCAAEYEDGLNDGSYPTLSELPQRYNQYGGAPALDNSDLRRVHNWLQQVSFALRAAVMEQEEQKPTNGWANLSIPERVSKRLFDPRFTRRVFIAHPANSRYELKPLRYADANAILRWLKQEYMQKKAGKSPFGALPTPEEWEAYGLRGQTRTAHTMLMTDIRGLVHTARQMDAEGHHKEADQIYESLLSMQHNLEQLACLTVE